MSTALVCAPACCAGCGKLMKPKRVPNRRPDLCRTCFAKTTEGKAFRVLREQERKRMNSAQELNNGHTCPDCVHWERRCLLGFKDPGVGDRFAVMCAAFVDQATRSTTSAQPLPGA